MLAAAHQRGEFTPLRFAQFDMIAYVHLGLLRESLGPDESDYESIAWRTSPAPPFTDKQGQYLAFIYANPPRKPTCSGTSSSRTPACARR
jgi:hypothetical protein